jgi:hypothetical protein
MLKLAEQVLVHSGVPYAKVASLAPMQIAKLMMGADPGQMGLGFLASSDGPSYNVSGMFSNLLEHITVDRLECISQAENGRRNAPTVKHPEVARLIQLKGAITRQVNRITQQDSQKEPRP